MITERFYNSSMSCFHSLKIDVLFSVLTLAVFTATTNTSQLVSILFNEDEIKARVGGTIGVSRPCEFKLHYRGYWRHIVIRSIETSEVSW